LNTKDKKKIHTISKYDNKKEARIDACNEYKKELMTNGDNKIIQFSKLDPIQIVKMPDTKLSIPLFNSVILYVKLDILLI
jgi:hypothetical protein